MRGSNTRAARTCAATLTSPAFRQTSSGAAAIQAGNHHRTCTRRCKSPGQSLAYALGTAGDDDQLVIEIHHVPFIHCLAAIGAQPEWRLQPATDRSLLHLNRTFLFSGYRTFSRCTNIKNELSWTRL